ncbi:MAG: HDOD domain-containing protein, partial [Nitrospirales bacterium]|nr:HDOD domain-containing protein [Nitrospirales bacterium]
RILFVDDDLQLLEGLQRMLRPMRQDWEMVFALGGPAALTLMEESPFDVIVSDVRMPGMNGVQLLTDIQHRFPHTIRILLSGHSDQGLILKAIGPVHQYLAKPCDPALLKSTIVRACALGGLLNNTAIQHLVSQIESLPSLPALYLELERELQSPDGSIDKAGAIIAKDLGMSAMMLKIVNSAFFGSPKSIADPLQAVLFLGLDTLKTLVLAIQVFQQMGGNVPKAFPMEQFWEDSLKTGDYARKIMKAEHGGGAYLEEAMAGGLLHDVGRLLLACKFPEEYQECLTISHTQKIPLETAERQILGTNHAEVGAYLLGLWGISTSIVEAVAFHHDPQQCPHVEFSALTVVHVAHALVAQERQPAPSEECTDKINIDYLTQLGLYDRVPQWLDLLQAPVSK